MLPSRSRSALLAVLALLASTLLAVAPATASAASTKASAKGLVVGVIDFPQHDRPKVTLLWFDSDWTFLGRKPAGGGTYALTLEPGTYHLQFVDQRPAYNIAKYAPTDVTVKVGDGGTSRNVTMKRGGYITGTVRTGDGRPAKKARVVAANRAQNSFETTANAKGQFAVGGLPQGKYSVFAWDKRKRWVAKSSWAGPVKPRHGKDVRVRLNKRAGSLRVLLRTPSGPMTSKTPVTVTSKATGQWWTATAKGGSVAFAGLYPGGYKLEFDGAGPWLASTGPVQGGKVRAGRGAIGIFNVNRHGATITGTAVDVEGFQSQTLTGVAVTAYDAGGSQLGSATTSSSGQYSLTGQIATQSVTLVFEPAGDNPPYLHGVGAHYCKFGRATTTVSTTAGRTLVAPAVQLPRLPAEQQPDPAVCARRYE